MMNYFNVARRKLLASFVLLLLSHFKSTFEVKQKFDRSTVPYILDFSDGGGGKCSGILIRPKIVLTAGHCVVRPVLDHITVFQLFGRRQSSETFNFTPQLCQLIQEKGDNSILGCVWLKEKQAYKFVGLNIAVETTEEQTRPVKRSMAEAVFVHDKYSNPDSAGILTIYDIAVVKLTEEIIINTYASLPKARLKVTSSTKLTAQGFGNRAIASYPFSVVNSNLSVTPKFYPCYVNGRGPSKFNICLREWTYDGKTFEGCTNEVDPPEEAFGQPQHLCTKFSRETKQLFKKDPAKKQVHVFRKKAGNEYLGTCYNPFLNYTSWCLTTDSYESVLNRGDVEDFPNKVGFCSDSCGLDNDHPEFGMDSDLIPDGLNRVQDPQHLDFEVCEKIWHREVQRANKSDKAERLNATVDMINMICVGNYEQVNEAFMDVTNKGLSPTHFKTERMLDIKKRFDRYENNTILDNTRLCVGDSGTGLIMGTEKAPIVIGIYTLSTGMCGGRNEASFFTDVTKYLTWIKDVSKNTFIQVKHRKNAINK